MIKIKIYIIALSIAVFVNLSSAQQSIVFQDVGAATGTKILIPENNVIAELRKIQLQRGLK